ncbi:DUF3953 domain-containing protein [Peribacillus alkalitolerans]|uniref:DUF3953 domain-containing protein n=1 Tax=Peribacillus alkalitolerans TaxID=1550385 RepID=UPI0013D01EB3|nr:DUF3953 domain-containing protein [Peribacillus alkalitolerans]
MNLIRVVLAIFIISLSSYSLITKIFDGTPYMMFFLGAFMLVIGLSEFKNDHKRVVS